MDRERAELVNNVFPKLRAICEERDIAWGEVDLRWGITPEESRQGKVLPICLAEIDQCRPYFLAMLGERYGWIPTTISLELIEREPWLRSATGRSVTELEILHAALNPAAAGAQAFFYFRSPGYLDTLAPELQTAFRDPPSAITADSGLGNKLAALKARIRLSGFPVREDYRDPKAFGELVFRDLETLIEREYPAGGMLDPLDREATAHDSFAARLTQIYVERSGDLARLDAHVRGRAGPLIVSGPSGIGKSALLANWARYYLRGLTGHDRNFSRLRGRWFRSRKPGVGPSAGEPRPRVILHFIGATASSANWMTMIRRIMGELKRQFAIPMEIPDRPSSLPGALSNFLQYGAARGRIVLVIDGLDQLEDRDSAFELAWLPTAIPAEVRLIVATAPGPSLEVLKGRGFSELEVRPLGLAERRLLTVDYLAQYRKKLDRDQIRRIVAAPAAASPLYLRTVLEELRLFGSYERLPGRITHYLEAVTPPQLYARVLSRCETEYQSECPGLVSAALCALWASRNGLGEPELLDLLGPSNSPLPSAHWSPLYLALGQSLVIRSGLLGFFHAALRDAVAVRYLAKAEDRRDAHRRIATYFGERGMTRRRVEERPWQLAEAGDWPELADELSNPEFLQAAWPIQPFEIKEAWARIENHEASRMVDRYRPIIEDPVSFPDCRWAVAVLLADSGHTFDGLVLTSRLEAIARSANDLNGLQASLALRARLLRERGKAREALEALRNQEAICRQSDDRAALAACLGGQGILLRDLGDLEGASALFSQEEEICRGLDDLEGIVANLGHRATVAALRRDHDGALLLFARQEANCRQLGDAATLAESLGNQGIMLRALGRLEDADKRHCQEEELCRRINDQPGLQSCLGHRAIIAQELGDYDTALALLDQKQVICRRIDDPAALAWTFYEQAFLFAERLNEPHHALALAEQAERHWLQIHPRHDERSGSDIYESSTTRTARLRERIELLLGAIRARLK
jgi:tetratricopeptide (TPR) repeat protein